MLDIIATLQAEAETFQTLSAEELEKFRIKFLGKKGELTRLFDDFKAVPNDQKKVIGQKLNVLKQLATAKYDELKNTLDSSKHTIQLLDLSAPPESYAAGSRHPVNIVMNDIIKIFNRLGFTISDGPEIEDDWHVFSALNFPPEHPARDMQDTFFISKTPDVLLRTHTSSVQVRTMESQQPPIRTISPGRVFRNEAISLRSHCMFHQIEGLYIDKNVSFADLKQTLLYFAKEYFGADTKIRLRPSFFPFTEPSAEMDISCSFCKGNGCAMCKYSGWIEILGCGMVHPNVLEASGIDSKVYTGYAFGIGIERMALRKFGITDIRMLFENDVRMLNQFSKFL